MLRGVACLICVLPYQLLQAQTAPPGAHSSQRATIRGSEHPELISEYIVWMFMFSNYVAFARMDAKEVAYSPDRIRSLVEYDLKLPEKDIRTFLDVADRALKRYFELTSSNEDMTEAQLSARRTEAAAAIIAGRDELAFRLPRLSFEVLKKKSFETAKGTEFDVPSSVTTAYSQDSTTIHVQDGRPLAKVIRTLEQRHGVVITYEEAPYLHEDQIADVTAAVARTPPKGGTVMVPRGGAFSFTSGVDANRRHPDLRTVLERLVVEHAGTGYAGAFSVLTTDDVFHIFPRTRRSREGKDEAFSPILGTRISIEQTGNRSALDVVQEIAETVTRNSGMPLVLGTIPWNGLERSKVSIRSDNEAARSVLTRTLAATGARLSWAVYASAQEPATFVLNIHGVPRYDVR